MLNHSVDLSSNSFRNSPYKYWESLQDRSKTLLSVAPFKNAIGIVDYDLIKECLDNTDVFSNELETEKSLLPKIREHFISGNLLTMDPPEHSQLRRKVIKPFTRKSLSSLKPKIEAICNSLMQDLPNNEMAFDFHKELATKLPISIICELLGIPSSMAQTFKEWTDATISAGFVSQMAPSHDRDQKEIEIASQLQALNKYFTEKCSEVLSMENPPENLLTTLVHSLVSKEDEAALAARRLIPMLRLLLVAGHETTTNLLSQCILILCEKPHLFMELKVAPELIPEFVEECLRYRPSIIALNRKVKKDVQVGVHSLKAGTRALFFISCANHDPDRFVNPGEFDLHRKNKREHLTFGYGVHNCFGSELARMETHIALKNILEKYSSVFLAEEGYDYCPSYVIRAFSKVWVQFKV